MADSKQLIRDIKDLQKENEILQQKLDRLRHRIDRMAIPPLLIATVSRLLDDGMVVIHTPSGNDFMVACPFLDIQSGETVGVDQSTLKIVKRLPPVIDSFVSGMELDRIPSESYSDIGGLDETIDIIREVVELPLTNPGIFKKIGISPPKGVLLQGPPGTGKTLLAKAVANATHACFIRLNGSELIRKYIGEGARLVRELFSLAREKSPSILFIDEIDAVASKRTQDSQVSDREVQRTLMQLLAEMDGFNPLGNVKVLAATNRPDILDPAILRPGRFDRIIKVGLPAEEGRVEIFKIHSRKMPLDKEINFMNFVRKWGELSGADIQAICTEAGMQAIRAVRDKVIAEDFIVGYTKFIKKDRDKGIPAPVYT